ncbi:MAG: rhodanese-like domain-containing protein [Chthoniobacterales bacterium]
MIPRIRLAHLLAPGLAVLFLAAARPDLDNLSDYIRSRYPDVPTVTTSRLASQLADPAQPTPVLLDVRSTDEFAVSHLDHATRIDPDRPVPTAITTLPRDTLIVTYCSVGYRSAQLADTLISLGFTNVRNLEGSIFQWANENRPLVRNDRPTRAVHPYNAIWGRYLDADLHASKPD